MRRMVTTIVLSGLCLIPAEALAQPAEESPRVHAELLGVLQSMAQLPPATRSQIYPEGFPWDDAQRYLAGAEGPELEVLLTLFGPGSQGAGLPGALEVLYSGSSLQPQAFRVRLLEITATLRELDGELPPDLAASLDRFDAGLQALTEEQLMTVMIGLAWNRPQPQQDSRASGVTSIVASIGDCTGSFPEKEICEIGALFQAVSDFFNETLPEFFTVTAPQAILGALQALVDAALSLIPTPEEMVALLGLDDPNWSALAASLPSGVFFPPPTTASSGSGGIVAQTAAADDSGLKLPCPAAGTDIIPFGVVGDIEAYYSCKRTAEWLLRAVFKTSPKDGEGLAVKIGAGLIYFPTKYLCGCFERSWFVPFWNDQLAHVADMTGRMDVNLSTRALQTDLDGAAAQALHLGEDTDTVLALAGDLDGRLADLLGAAGEQGDVQEELMELRLTHLIEVDLSRRASGPAVGIFQLPAAHGGLLEKAAAIVTARIAGAQAQGGNVKTAQASYEAGVALQEQGNYKGAYELYRYAYQQALREVP